jgi:GT2 family glycosyltransferase
MPSPHEHPTLATGCAVIVLNWNGADDTLECLRSLRDGGDPCRVVVVDNGSRDGSAGRIAAELAELGVPCVRCTPTAPPPALAPAAADGFAVWLLEAGENLGFAAGCNAGLRVAQALGCGLVAFLNNDTVVEPGALGRLVARLEAEPGCFATLPMITVHGRDRIWNCGGTLWRIGLRRYHLAGRPRAEGARRGEIRCSFFTGCCFVTRTAAFAARGGFSERFFFGEEDFELALWLQAQGGHAVCLPSAVVQHKVSAALGAASAAAADPRRARVAVHYLNRFIHMRLRLGRWRWRLWCAAYLPYVALLLWRSGTLAAPALPGFVRRLLARAGTMDRVSRSDFEAVMAGRW